MAMWIVPHYSFKSDLNDTRDIFNDKMILNHLYHVEGFDIDVTQQNSEIWSGIVLKFNQIKNGASFVSIIWGKVLQS